MTEMNNSDLPELQLCGNFQLFKSSVKVQLQSLWSRNVGSISLVPILVEISKMISDNFT